MRLAAMNTHYRYYSLEYFFRSVSELGYECCEIWTSPHHFEVMDRFIDNPKVLNDLALKYGLEIICICPEQTNPKPYNIAEKSEDKQVRVFQYFSNIIDLAFATSAKYIVITSGWCFYDENRNKAYKRSVEMMKRVCMYAASKGIFVALEALQNDESILVNTISDIKAYRKAVGSPYLKVCLDMGAMARSGESINDYFDVFGTDIVHVHFVDGNPVGHLAWGDGDRCIHSDLNDFKKNHYSGVLSLENATSRYYENPRKADALSLTLFKETEQRE